jgi:uncharacterized protein DUF1203
MTTTFRIHPIPAPDLDAVRAGEGDAAGNPVERRTAGGGEPLRCCLRNAAPGEELILFGYRLPTPPSPYREVGPVFAHARACPGPARSDAYPPDWYGRPQVLRAYDRHSRIHEATRTHDGTDPETVIAAMLADPEVVQLHSRNIAWGCFMFAITRAAPVASTTLD